MAENLKFAKGTGRGGGTGCRRILGDKRDAREGNGKVFAGKAGETGRKRRTGRRGDKRDAHEGNGGVFAGEEVCRMCICRL